MPLPLVKVDRLSAYQAVQEQLLALIASGVLAVGDRLPAEKDLSASLGVSRPVIREALGSLRATGVIRTEVGRGTFVASPTPREPVRLLQGKYSAQDLFEVRSDLEVHGASHAALRRDERDIEELEGMLDAMSSVTDPQEWTVLDAKFHIRLAEATANKLYRELIEHLRAGMSELSRAVASMEQRMPEAHAEHREILDAVAAGDEHRATLAMRHHLEMVAERAALL